MLQRSLTRTTTDSPEVRGDYIGRGMRTPCFGIVCHPDDLGGVVLAVIDVAHFIRQFDDVDVIDSAWPLVKTMRTDSMGLGIIVYFPGWQLDGTMP